MDDVEAVRLPDLGRAGDGGCARRGTVGVVVDDLYPDFAPGLVDDVDPVRMRGDACDDDAAALVYGVVSNSHLDVGIGFSFREFKVTCQRLAVVAALVAPTEVDKSDFPVCRPCVLF